MSKEVVVCTICIHMAQKGLHMVSPRPQYRHSTSDGKKHLKTLYWSTKHTKTINSPNNKEAREKFFKLFHDNPNLRRAHHHSRLNIGTKVLIIHGPDYVRRHGIVCGHWYQRFGLTSDHTPLLRVLLANEGVANIKQSYILILDLHQHLPFLLPSNLLPSIRHLFN